MIEKIETVLDGFELVSFFCGVIYIIGNIGVAIAKAIDRKNRLKTEIYKRPFNDDVVFK